MVDSEEALAEEAWVSAEAALVATLGTWATLLKLETLQVRLRVVVTFPTTYMPISTVVELRRQLVAWPSTKASQTSRSLFAT